MLWTAEGSGQRVVADGRFQMSEICLCAHFRQAGLPQTSTAPNSGSRDQANLGLSSVFKARQRYLRADVAERHRESPHAHIAANAVLRVIAAMMAAFVWGRFRYDLVAALALLLALTTGIVPLKDAFTGSSDDIVIIVGSALLVSAGVARSGIMEWAIQRYAPNVSSVRAQLALLVVLVANRIIFKPVQPFFASTSCPPGTETTRFSCGRP